MGVFDFFSIGGGKKPPATGTSKPESAKPASPPAQNTRAGAEKDRKEVKKDAKKESVKPAPAKPQPIAATAPAEKPALVAAPAPQVTAQAKPDAAPVVPPPPIPVIAEEAEVDRALDSAFGEGASQSVTHVSQIAKELDESAVRELYGSIAANHARPIKNLIFELKRGTATKEWIEVCRPIMSTLIEGADSMGLPEAAKAMADFDEALVLAQEGTSHLLTGATRDLILRGFEEMAQTLPEAFALGDGERRRESIIIHALLKQVPDVGSVTFERLYGAGLTSLEALFLARKDDLAATTGIPVWLCERICERIQEHRKELDRLQKSSPDGERRDRLRSLVQEMKQRHAGFSKAVAEEWTNPALAEEKKEHRQGRQLSALQIDVVLAEMGELELVEQLQKLPFEQRIARLEEFLASPIPTAASEVHTKSPEGAGVPA